MMENIYDFILWVSFSITNTITKLITTNFGFRIMILCVVIKERRLISFIIKKRYIIVFFSDAVHISKYI